MKRLNAAWIAPLALLILVCLAGCEGALARALGFAASPPPALPPASHPVIVDPPRAGESAEASTVRQLRSQLGAAKGQEATIATALRSAEDDLALSQREALVAPIRTTFVWAAWIGGLGILAGAALAVASLVWTVSLGWKGGATIAAIGAVVLAGSLAGLFALDAAVRHPWITIAIVFGCVALVVAGYVVLRRAGAVTHGVLGEVARTGHDALTQLEQLGHQAEADAVRGAAAFRQDQQGLRTSVRRIRTRLGLRKPEGA